MTQQTKTPANILVVDDDKIILDSLVEFLSLEGYIVVSAQSFTDAMRLLDANPIDIVLSDINMPGGNGFELLAALKKKHPEIGVIMMTGYGTIESAVEAIKLGAHDYLTKPIHDDELILCVQRAIAQHFIVEENQQLKKRLDQRYGLDAIMGHDHRMLRIFDLVETIADSKVSVLVQGPSGTGKSLIAGVIHQQSARRDKPFIEVSCGSLPETLLESELFGHARGAFTGAVSNKIGKFKAADGGTLFLDEISSASPAMQVKLLRVLQSHQFEPVGSNKTETVDVRLIVATNVDLEQEVEAGRFRQDLYYRINVVCIDMPKLCDRMADVPLLANHFIQNCATEYNSKVTGLDDEVVQALQRYNWPGNVRELQNIIARAVVLCQGTELHVEHLPEKILSTPHTNHSSANYIPMPLKQALEVPEKRILESALRANDWNRQATAEQLDINRTTLYKKMKRYGLDLPLMRAT